MRAVVCLGNPGVRYVGTRHNIGFRVADRLAEAPSGDWAATRHSDRIDIVVDCERVVVVKPTTFMNDSGLAVGELLRDTPVALSEVMVVSDDVHLDLGRLRVRRSGSHGGHNGLRSIIDETGSNEFPRVRMGIGAPPEGVDRIEFVLGTFLPDEEPVVNDLVETVAIAVKAWVTEGVDEAMNRYNAIVAGREARE